MAYNYYGQPVSNGWGNTQQYQPYQQQSYAPAPQPQMVQGMIWVDGEVGAKAFQMPQGWPVGTPIPLWDTNDTVIYLKSMNQMGMPNPLQKIHYTMDEQQQSGYLPAAANQVSGNAEQNYVTKADLDQKMNELKEMLKNNQQQSRNQNSQQNRGANT